MITALDHVNLVVSNLEEAAAFFALLGFEKRGPSPLSGEWFERAVGLPGAKAYYAVLTHPSIHTTIELIRYDTPGIEPNPGMADPNRVGIRHMAFAVDDIEATCASLRAHGVTVLSEIQVYIPAGKRFVYFLGPDRILLELAEYSTAKTAGSA